jgi:hypothetical protein
MNFKTSALIEIGAEVFRAMKSFIVILSQEVIPFPIRVHPP